MKNMNELLQEHNFFKEFNDDHLQLLAGCGINRQVQEGEYLFRMGEAANHFFLIRRGRLSLELNSPAKGPCILSTHQCGEVIGWAWIFPPYQWTYDCRALSDVSLTVLDGQCLRQKCEDDPELGYQMMKRFSLIMVQRLKATRMQILDLYGEQ